PHQGHHSNSSNIRAVRHHGTGKVPTRRFSRANGQWAEQTRNRKIREGVATPPSAPPSPPGGGGRLTATPVTLCSEPQLSHMHPHRLGALTGGAQRAHAAGFSGAPPGRQAPGSGVTRVQGAPGCCWGNTHG